MPALIDIQRARERIAPFLIKTPTVFSVTLSDMLQAKVFLKLENMQRTGSFKERGALNRLLLLSDEQKSKGVVTASAGNHAQGVACHASRLHIPSTVFMPRHAPIVKIVKTERYGATVKLIGDTFDDAHEAAKQWAKDTGAFYLHAFDDDAVIAGQGTIGLELIEEVPDVDMVVVPVGGGGLLSGIASAMRDKHIRFIGVEPEVLPSMAQALKAKHLVTLPSAQTLADGIATRCVAQKTYDICVSHVHEWIKVSDDDIERAIFLMLEQQKLMVEGAGAAGVAALILNQIDDVKNRTIVVLVGGGNIDVHLISRVIERGMVESGRLVRLGVAVLDRPGALGVLLETLGRAGANVMAIHHERAFTHLSFSDVQVDLVVETRGESHVKDLIAILHEKGFKVCRE